MFRLFLIIFIGLINIGCSYNPPVPTVPGELLWSARYGGSAICVARDNNVLCTSDRATTYYTPRILENRAVNNVSGPGCYLFLHGDYDRGTCQQRINSFGSYPSGSFMWDVGEYRRHNMINVLTGQDSIFRTIMLRDRYGNAVYN